MDLFGKASIFALALIARAALGAEPLSDTGNAGTSEKIDLAQASVAAPLSPLEDLLARARALSRSHRDAEAYELLAAAEDIYIGTVAFDYALGRAALDAGRPDKATLAFTRVLALQPAHAGARIDMGRAYLALGDFARAQSTFRTLLAQNPPPEIRAQLVALLERSNAAAAQSTAPTGVPRRGYVALLAGYSTNVNQSPSQSSIFVPALGSDFRLADQNVKKPDGFAGLSGGVDFSQPLDGTYSFDFGGEFLLRRNFHEFDFDLGGIRAYVGLTATTSRHAWRIQRQAGRDYLGRKASRDFDAVAFNYVGFIDGPTQLLTTVQGGRLRHVPADLKVFDADYVTLGAGAAHRVGERSTVFGMILTSSQNDVDENPSGDRRGLGLRAGGETTLTPRLKLTGTLAAENGRYDKFDTGFEVERLDRRLSVDAEIQYALEANLSLRFSASHVTQRSNIPIYEYNKSEWLLMLRRDF
jgi:tetratricopeptide (TPR) repeat protein